MVLDALDGAGAPRRSARRTSRPAPSCSSATSATATCSPTCCAECDAVYHFAAYQDYLTDFARFTDVNVTSTALIYEIAVAEGLDLSAWWSRPRSRPWARVSTAAPSTASRRPGMRPEAALRRRAVGDPPARSVAGQLELRRTPETVSNPQNAYGMSKYGEEMVALNLGRRYGIPTVALRYSIVQGPRQSVYNAYSGACRIFCLHYLLGSAPALYEDGQADPRLRQHPRRRRRERAGPRPTSGPRAGSSTSAAARRYTTSEFAEIVRRQYGSERPGSDQRRVPLRRHPPHLLRHRRPGGARLEAAAHARRLRRRVRRLARGHAGARRDPRRGGREDARARRRPQGAVADMKAFLLAAGLGTRLRPLTDSVPKCLVDIGGPPAARHLAGRAGVGRRRRGPAERAPPARPGRGARRGARRSGAVRQGRPRAAPCSAAPARCAPTATSWTGEPFFLAINADNLTDFDLGRLIDAHHAARARWPRWRCSTRHDPERCGIVEVEDGLVVGFEEKPAHPAGDLANAGMYAFDPQVLDLIDGDRSRTTSASTCCRGSSAGRGSSTSATLLHRHRHPRGAGAAPARRGREEQRR